GELRVPEGDDPAHAVLEETGLDAVEVARELAPGFVHAKAASRLPESWEHRGRHVRWEPVRADAPIARSQAAHVHALVRKRVVGYVTRDRRRRHELLVFDHRDMPDVPTQVPAGRIDAHEDLETGLRREVEEETGVTGIRVVGELADADEVDRLYGVLAHRTWAFHARADAHGPDRWDHPVTGTGMDSGLVFVCRWVPVEECPPLWGKADPLVEKLRRSIGKA
ncbi:MAG TPA: NUDIX domain-containing protein, partial [Gaiellaceae bacterium]|nr:NUDIX domain-containing protein [Gaiellaceae bacterium]